MDRFVASENCGYCFEGPKLGGEIETTPVEALKAFTDIQVSSIRNEIFCGRERWQLDPLRGVSILDSMRERALGAAITLPY